MKEELWLIPCVFLWKFEQVVGTVALLLGYFLSKSCEERYKKDQWKLCQPKQKRGHTKWPTPSEMHWNGSLPGAFSVYELFDPTPPQICNARKFQHYGHYFAANSAKSLWGKHLVVVRCWEPGPDVPATCPPLALLLPTFAGWVWYLTQYLTCYLVWFLWIFMSFQQKFSPSEIWTQDLRLGKTVQPYTEAHRLRFFFGGSS